MNQALELFKRIPRVYNCAQSVAAGCDRVDLVGELASCGGGRAPEGRCGALHAAMMIAPPEKREAIRQAFIAENGSEFCRELKTVHRVPCEKCVDFAASMAEKAME